MSRKFCLGLFLCCVLTNSAYAQTPTDEVLYKIGEHIGTLFTWKNMPGFVLNFCESKYPDEANKARINNEQWKSTNGLAIENANRQIERYAILFANLQKLALQAKGDKSKGGQEADSQSLKESWRKRSESIITEELIAGRTPEQLTLMCNKYENITTMMSSEKVRAQITQATQELETIFETLPAKWKQ